MEERVTGRCPVKSCSFGAKADVETLSSALAMHLRDIHGSAMSDATQAAWLAVKQGQETAFKVDRMQECLAGVFEVVSAPQARAVLKALAGHGLVIRVAEGTTARGGAAQQTRGGAVR